MDTPSRSKTEKMNQFNPDGVGLTNNNIFGLPFTPAESDVVIIPVPWDLTVSSKAGTSSGPENIFNESFQIDLYDENNPDAWKAGIAMEEIPEETYLLNKKLRKKAQKLIDYLEKHGSIEGIDKWEKKQAALNKACKNLSNTVYSKSKSYLEQSKQVVILGGDHSTPLGLIKALSEIHQDFGILQIDAHADLRPAYEGFSQSHASIMYNALSISQIKKFVQVGIRDYCKQEVELINQNAERISCFFDHYLSREQFKGKSWAELCTEIVNQLPDKVYITIDVDGLKPEWCPGTGTPVPGGLEYNQLLFLFECVAKSGREIIGFDLVETGNKKLDGIISCRILYKTIAIMLATKRS